MNAIERIIECFEAIAHGRLQILNNGDSDAVDLISAQILVEPRIHSLRQQVAEIYNEYSITDPRLESLRAAESVSSYIVGVLSGLDLAGRPEVVSRFAKLYVVEAKPAVDALFSPAKPTALASIRGGRA